MLPSTCTLPLTYYLRKIDLFIPSYIPAKTAFVLQAYALYVLSLRLFMPFTLDAQRQRNRICDKAEKLWNKCGGITSAPIEGLAFLLCVVKVCVCVCMCVCVYVRVCVCVCVCMCV